MKHEDIDHTGLTGVGVGDATAHIADTTDAHDASAISVADAGGNFTGTDVEAVLAELQDNIDAVSAGAVVVPSARVRLSSGNITGGNTQSAFTAITATALDLDIAAATGDVLELSINNLTTNTGNGETYFDVATVVSAALTNYTSGGASNGKGIMGLYRANNAPPTCQGGATWQYVVQAGDISGGSVKLRPVYYNSGSSNGTIFASAYPFHFSVKNLGH